MSSAQQETIGRALEDIRSAVGRGYTITVIARPANPKLFPIVVTGEMAASQQALLMQVAQQKGEHRG
jgi:hypothetical protein